MALRLADLAYVLEVGRVTLRGPAARLAATDEVRARYLGIGGPAVAPTDRPTGGAAIITG